MLTVKLEMLSGRAALSGNMLLKLPHFLVSHLTTLDRHRVYTYTVSK